ERREIVDSGERQRACHQPARAQRKRLNGERAQMFVESGAPGKPDRIAGLQRRTKARRPSAAHETEMAAVRARQRLYDHGRLAVLGAADDEPLVAPFHVRGSLYEARRLGGGGTCASFKAMRRANADITPRKAASPGHAASEKTQPPNEPATLEPA